MLSDWVGQTGSLPHVSDSLDGASSLLEEVLSAPVLICTPFGNTRQGALQIRFHGAQTGAKYASAPRLLRKRPPLGWGGSSRGRGLGCLRPR